MALSGAARDIAIRIGLQEMPGSQDAANRIQRSLNTIAGINLASLMGQLRGIGQQIIEVARIGVVEGSKVQSMRERFNLSARDASLATGLGDRLLGDGGGERIQAMMSKLLVAQTKRKLPAGVSGKSGMDLLRSLMAKAAGMTDVGAREKMFTGLFGRGLAADAATSVDDFAEALTKVQQVSAGAAASGEQAELAGRGGMQNLRRNIANTYNPAAEAAARVFADVTAPQALPGRPAAADRGLPSDAWNWNQLLGQKLRGAIFGASRDQARDAVANAERARKDAANDRAVVGVR